MPEPMLDLPVEWRAKLERLLIRYVPAYEVLAYGSRTNGTNHATSDLDLVVRNPLAPGLECPTLAALRSSLRESDLPISVDVHDWALLPDSFRSEIATRHVVLFCTASGRNV